MCLGENKMITKEQIDRINELARKSKSEGLTPEETEEQHKLRRLYIDQFKKNTKAAIDNVVIVNPDGSKNKIKHNPKPKRKH